MASIAETRGFFDTFVLADISREAAENAIRALDDPGKFEAEQVDASSVDQLVALIERTKADVIVNACDPRLNPQIFEAAYRVAAQLPSSEMRSSASCTNGVRIASRFTLSTSGSATKRAKPSGPDAISPFSH